MKLQSIIFIFIFLIKINLNEGYGSILTKWDFLLPQEMMERIFALESDPTIDKMEVEKATDELLRSLPKNILDQLQLPQFYAGLPFNVRFPIKQLLFDPSLNWQQKHERIFQIIQNVPPILRKFGPSFPSTVSNGPSQKQHSRLFDSTRALKYSISFTFNLDELRNTIPIDKYMQIYNILEDNSLNIEKKKWALERLILELPSFSIITQQKMWAIERAMLELPSQILDKLFFIDSQIEPQMREKLRQYLFGHSTFTLMEGNAMDGNGQQQNVMTQQTMEQPILIWPNSLPSSSYGRVSILTQPIQIHQQKYGTGANFVSSSATFPAGKTTAISIDEHYNVLAPSSPSQIVEGEGVPKEGGEGNSEGQNMDSGIWNNYEGGLCAECNGIPNQMFSVRNIPQKVNPERKEGKGVRIRIPTFEENSEMDDAKTWPIEENAKKENIKIEKGTAKKSAANFMDPMIELNSAESDKNGNKNKVGVRRKHHLIRRNHLRVHNMNRLLMNILDNKDGKLGAI